MELAKTRRGNKHLPLGCRFVPYDQWFLTHIPPTWKIRHLKQHILAKCLHLPWDARKIVPARDADPDVSALRGVGSGGGGAALAGTSIGGGGGADGGMGMGRPPSPITFAPEERERPISPIEFATPLVSPRVESHPKEKEEGEQWEDLGSPINIDDDDDVEEEGQEVAEEEAVIPGGRVEVPHSRGGGFIPNLKPLSKLASSTTSASIPFSPLSGTRTRLGGPSSSLPPTRISAQQPQQQQQRPYGTRPDEQIHITGFTLVRFTTGQILEAIILLRGTSLPRMNSWSCMLVVRSAGFLWRFS
ncbi:hypothetical protein M413DRAFT_318702 [Hebeloma cylindrosporum]|uniref:Uncharacterized protein n=1 Tax=Hebeloma cylindrosporum TaxID=76867 RepID=A0A0C3BVX2_HEBCY|nr:hypothetical protein M413DRAFT_318702 [Hebeloma cylindrosporum h7]